VVDESDLEELGGFEEFLGEMIVRSAREGAAGGVVMSDDEAVGLIDDDGLENVARVGDGLIGRAAGDFDDALELELAIEGEDVEALGSLGGDEGSEVFVDGEGVAELGFVDCFLHGAGPEFEGGEELAGFGKSEAVFTAELLDIERAKSGEAAVFFDQAVSDLDGAHPFCPGAEEDGEKLCSAEGGGSVAEHALARTLVGREVLDQITLAHERRVSIFPRSVASYES